MTSESAVIAPTTPSTEAITRRGAQDALRFAERCALSAVLGGERLADRPLVAGLTARDRRRRPRGPARRPRPRRRPIPVRVGRPDRDRQRVGRVVGSWPLAHARGRAGPSAGPAPCPPRRSRRSPTLHLARRRLAHRRPVLGGRQQHDAARLADGERRLHVPARRTAARRRRVRLWSAISSSTRAWIASRRSGSDRSGVVTRQPWSTSRSAATRRLDDPVPQRRGPRVDARGRSPGDLGEDFLGDVEVGGDARDVVEVLERARRAGAPGAPSTRRARRSASRSSWTRPTRPARRRPRAPGPDRLEVGRRRVDLDRLVAVGVDVLGAGVDGRQRDLVRVDARRAAR